MNCFNCIKILTEVNAALSAQKNLIAAAETQAFILSTQILERLVSIETLEGTPNVELMRYGSNFGEWAVEDSDLDVVAVIYARLDSNEVKNALETAFLCLFYLQLWNTETLKV